MAEHLARIIGTEEDRVNCPFYWKIGACRHGDQCSRSHYKPTCSQTLVLRHMYRNPPVALAIAEGQEVDDALADEAQDHFESFFEEVFEELAKYGQIEEMVVCDNIGDHMIGNVYVKYSSEDDAEKAVQLLRGRYYAGRIIEVEFSPVTDFREARCRQFVDGQCTRGGYCNFMHMKHVPRSLKRKMIRQMLEEHPEYKKSSPPTDRTNDEGNRPRGDHRRDRYSPKGRHHRDREEVHHKRRSRSVESDHYRRRRRQVPSPPPRERHADKPSHANDRNAANNHSDYHGRQSSHERRAMIAQWNEEADNVT